MYRLLVILFIIIAPQVIFCQPTDSDNDSGTETSGGTKLNTRDSRISFIVGPGASYITSRLYDNPSVNQTTNNVIIEKASRMKTNLAVGIVYTPFLYRFPTVDGEDDDEVVPKGISFSTFINPLAFSKVAENEPFFNMLDFGIGAGYRSKGGFLVMATMEFFTIKQPRQWFIDKYETGEQQYIVEGEIQKSISLDDNSIFKSKTVTTLGFKFCYTFDIIKNYTRTTTED
jgi:hypothetical protein